MKKNIIATLLIGATCLCASCGDDFMETKSTENVDQEQMFETTEGGMMAVNGLHKLMYTPSLSSTYAEGGFQTFMIWLDVMGEDLVYTVANAQFQSQAKWTLHRNPTSGHLEYQYDLFYIMIANANMIISNIDGAEGTQEEKGSPHSSMKRRRRGDAEASTRRRPGFRRKRGALMRPPLRRGNGAARRFRPYRERRNSRFHKGRSRGAIRPWAG